MENPYKQQYIKYGVYKNKRTREILLSKLLKSRNGNVFLRDYKCGMSIFSCDGLLKRLKCLIIELRVIDVRC